MDNINLRLEELNDKPDIRELTLRNGIYYPSDEELIMLILGRGTRKNPIELLSQEVIDMLNASNDENLIQNLVSIEGIGTSRALVIAAALELGRRRNSYQKKAVNKPSDIVPYVQHYSLKPTEHFVTATVNGAHELIKIRLISVGTTNRTLVHPQGNFCRGSFRTRFRNNMLPQPPLRKMQSQPRRHRVNKSSSASGRNPGNNVYGSHHNHKKRLLQLS